MAFRISDIIITRMSWGKTINIPTGLYKESKRFNILQVKFKRKAYTGIKHIMMLKFLTIKSFQSYKKILPLIFGAVYLKEV